MSAWLTLSEAAFAVTTLVCGVWLLRTRSATASGALLAATGIGVFGVIGCAANGATQAVDIGLRITLGVLLSLAVACYPRVQAGVISLTLLSAVGLAGTVMVLAAPAVAWMPLAIVLFLLLAIWWAWENGEAHTRRALMWSTTAWLGACLLIALVSFTGDALAGTAVDPGPLVPLLGLFGPIAMVVGAVCGDVVDVRGIVTPLVVNATVVAVFVAVTVGGLGLVEADRGGPLPLGVVALTCAGLAFAVRPLQVVLRGVVDEVLFGKRPDPLRAASSLVGEVADSPQTGLDALREAMLLPYAAIETSGRVELHSGTPVAYTRTFALTSADQPDTRLIVGMRPGDLRLSADDEQVLRIVTPLFTQTLRAGQLAERLRHSVEREITAVEEERRRLRRDLHDGIGPLLSGAAFTADAAANRVQDSPTESFALIAAVRGEVTAALGEIRRIALDLRPPALDQLGLNGALRQRAESTYGADGRRIEVGVQIEAGPLPAAIEVTTYRIAVEALTNAARHSLARQVRIKVTEDGNTLRINVTDNGASPGPSWEAGTGLTSMHERAELLGGTIHAGPSPTGGRVEATLPLPHSATRRP